MTSIFIQLNPDDIWPRISRIARIGIIWGLLAGFISPAKQVLQVLGFYAKSLHLIIHFDELNPFLCLTNRELLCDRRALFVCVVSRKTTRLRTPGTRRTTMDTKFENHLFFNQQALFNSKIEEGLFQDLVGKQAHQVGQTCHI